MGLFPEQTEIRGDDADVANAHIEQELERAIEAARHLGAELPMTGVCLNCEEAVEAARFCDAECRDDYARRGWMERQNG
jgi:hypothetical protein